MIINTPIKFYRDEKTFNYLLYSNLLLYNRF